MNDGGKVKRKECFGILDKVFPVGKSGLREITQACFECPDRTACLREALKTREGIKMQEEILERAACKGMIGRLRRWSRKKELHRLMETADRDRR